MSVTPHFGMTGRTVIYTDNDIIDASNVVTVLKKSIPTHLINKMSIDYLYRYNKGDQPILYREKEVRPKINNKIVVNRANEITSFHVGYLLGEPLQYVSRNPKNDISDKITQLNDYMYAENKSAKDKELADWFTICGTAFRMVLPNSSKVNNDSPFNVYTLDPRQTFVVYHNGLGNKPVMGVKYVERSDGKKVYSVYTENEYFEIVDFIITRQENHTLKDIPIIEYAANTNHLGAFEIVLPLLDAYNLTVSDRMNGLEQFIQSLMKFVNVDISEEQVEQLRDLGAIKFKSTNENPADVDYLTPELNQSNTQSILTDMYQTILTICGMPNRNGGSSTSDTGSAVIMRDGWEVAEAKAKDTELMFKRSEKQFLRLVLRITKIMVNLDMNVMDIDLRFTRRNYENISNKATVLTTLLSNNKIHPKLAFQHCGMFADAELAYKISEEYAKEQDDKLQNQQLLDGNNGGINGNKE